MSRRAGPRVSPPITCECGERATHEYEVVIVCPVVRAVNGQVVATEWGGRARVEHEYVCPACLAVEVAHCGPPMGLRTLPAAPVRGTTWQQVQHVLRHRAHAPTALDLALCVPATRESIRRVLAEHVRAGHVEVVYAKSAGAGEQPRARYRLVGFTVAARARTEEAG